MAFPVKSKSFVVQEWQSKPAAQQSSSEEREVSRRFLHVRNRRQVALGDRVIRGGFHLQLVVLWHRLVCDLLAPVTLRRWCQLCGQC